MNDFYLLTIYTNQSTPELAVKEAKEKTKNLGVNENKIDISLHSYELGSVITKYVVTLILRNKEE